MTDPADSRYTISGRRLIAETEELRVQILTLEPGEEIPWHYHTNVTDTFVCLEGPMIVATRVPVASHELGIGDTFEVPPNTPHQVEGRGRCRFVIVQGIGRYDYFPLGPDDLR